MKVTRASDYAVRVLVHLAAQDDAARATREILIEKTHTPAAFLNKIVQQLVKARLMVARPGVAGGCSLAVPAADISILRVIEAIDGPLEISECLSNPSLCERSGVCGLRKLLDELREEMVRILGGRSVADLARQGIDSAPCLPAATLRCGRAPAPSDR